MVMDTTYEQSQKLSQFENVIYEKSKRQFYDFYLTAGKKLLTPFLLSILDRDQTSRHLNKSLAYLTKPFQFEYYRFVSKPTNNAVGGIRNIFLSGQYADEITHISGGIFVTSAWMKNRRRYRKLPQKYACSNITVKCILINSLERVSDEKKKVLERLNAEMIIHNQLGINFAQHGETIGRTTVHPLMDLFTCAPVHPIETGNSLEKMIKNAKMARISLAFDHEREFFEHDSLPVMYNPYRIGNCFRATDEKIFRQKCEICNINVRTKSFNPSSLQVLSALSLHAKIQLEHLQIYISGDLLNTLITQEQIPKHLGGFIQNLRFTSIPTDISLRSYSNNSRFTISDYPSTVLRKRANCLLRYRHSYIIFPYNFEHLIDELQTDAFELLGSELLILYDNPDQYIVKHIPFGGGTRNDLEVKMRAYAIVTRKDFEFMGDVIPISWDDSENIFMNVSIV